MRELIVLVLFFITGCGFLPTPDDFPPTASDDAYCGMAAGHPDNHPGTAYASNSIQ